MSKSRKKKIKCAKLFRKYQIKLFCCRIRSAEKAEDSSGFIYEKDSSLAQFRTRQLTGKLVEDWYKKRCYEIESFTGLVEFALSFVKLARERNIKVSYKKITNK